LAQILEVERELYQNVAWPDFLFDSMIYGKAILSNAKGIRLFLFQLTGQQ
jgi:hypothetical protein